MLFGSMVLEVAIGMVFVYLLMSLLCSAINEYIESYLNNRAKDLERGIRALLNDPQGEGLAKALYEHPLVKGLYRDKNRLPSYIPSRTFTLALWNMATSAGAQGSAAGVTNQLQTIRQTIVDTKAINSDVKTALLTLIDESGNNLERARANIEEWYNGGMDRVSGWYKRRVQIFLLVIGLVVATIINADTVKIGKALIQNDTLRSAVVANAEAIAKTPPAEVGKTPPADAGKTPQQRVEETRAMLSGVGLPIGWVKIQRDAQTGAVLNEFDPRRVPDTLSGWILKLFGLLLTGLAISQGAPFWFDLLNKFMVIRSTVKPNEKSGAQPSKDRPAPETEVKKTDAEEAGTKPDK